MASGILLGEGMAYCDARLSRKHPTLVRVTDACLTPRTPSSSPGWSVRWWRRLQENGGRASFLARSRPRCFGWPSGPAQVELQKCSRDIRPPIVPRPNCRKPAWKWSSDRRSHPARIPRRSRAPELPVDEAGAGVQPIVAAVTRGYHRRKGGSPRTLKVRSAGAASLSSTDERWTQ